MTRIILGQRYISTTDAAGDYHFAMPIGVYGSKVLARNMTSGIERFMTFASFRLLYTICEP